MATESRRPQSSSDVRDTMLAHHQGLRRLLAATVALVEDQARSGGDLDALRVRARMLYQACEAQLGFEAEALPVALRDVIGWGDVLQAEIQADHERQRATLAAALAALEPDSLSWVDLAEDVKAFAAALLIDLNREEADLLIADVDAEMADGRGG